MSLARAFTTRRGKVFGGDGEGKPTRSLTVNRGTNGGTVRSKISAPMQLVSTTNPLSYNAPDIIHNVPLGKTSASVGLTQTTNRPSYEAPDVQKQPRTAASDSSMSLRSDRESDHVHTAGSSPPTSPDSAFPGGGDHDLMKSPTAAPNHLSSYFTLPSEASFVAAPDAPSLPKRAPSHTSRQHEPLSPKLPLSGRLNRKVSMSERMGRKPSMSTMSEQSSRSVSTKASASFSRVSSASTSTTASSQHSFGAHQALKTTSQAPPPIPAVLSLAQHKASGSAAEPFGQELAQVTELAEEYAISAAKKTRHIATLEERELAERGLQKFSPEEYAAEISSLISTFFGEALHVKNPAPQWI
ncbi:unnamed protein product [Discula destructiva]